MWEKLCTFCIYCSTNRPKAPTSSGKRVPAGFSWCTRNGETLHHYRTLLVQTFSGLAYCALLSWRRGCVWNWSRFSWNDRKEEARAARSATQSFVPLKTKDHDVLSVFNVTANATCLSWNDNGAGKEGIKCVLLHSDLWPGMLRRV